METKAGEQMAATAPTCTADVVVCGAGPVGLVAAALLAVRGVDVVVLEQRSGTSDEPKAISIDDEALRLFQQAGIIDRVLPVIVPGTGTRYYGGDGQVLFHATGPQPFRLGYPFKNPFAQPDLERVLAECLAEVSNVRLRFNTRVIGFDQHGSGVAVHAVGPEGDLIVEAAYVLGCDGGRSSTRLLQGIDMSGRSYDDVWLVVDALDDMHNERFAMHHGDPTRPHVIVPGLDGRCRYEFRLFDGEGTPDERPPFELIERLVSRYRPITPPQVERAVNYRFNAVVADEWMLGRTFLLGDAAHMMPPFAGQGLNSGIRDAANLTWKVAGVLSGTLNPSVLSSYQVERLPHAQATVDLSEMLGRVVMTTSQEIADQRDRAVSQALATKEGRAYLEEMRYRPEQRYSEGMVVTGDVLELVGAQIGQPLVFNAEDHRIVRIDEVLGNGFALLGVDIDEGDWRASEDLASVLEAATLHVAVGESMPRTKRRVVLDVDGALAREFASYVGRFVLVRPDRVVAAAWWPSDTARVAAQIMPWTNHRAELNSSPGRI